MLNANLAQPRIGVLTGIVITTIFLVLLLRQGPEPIAPGLGPGVGDYRSRAFTNRTGSLLDDVYNRTLGFERVLVLNMPPRTDHRDAISLSAALTGFRVDYIDGVNGHDVSNKSLPNTDGNQYGPGVLGSWRAHMNAMHEIVNKEIGSALIFEDDIDWDYRLKDLLYDFARSANAIQHVDRARPWGQSSKLDFKSLPSFTLPEFSPYGDDWDVLWLGHCGMRIRTDHYHVVHEHDHSVPQVQYLKSWEEDVQSPLAPYGDHVRMVGRNDGTCSLAYAVTQRGARKILYEMGLNKFWAAVDVMLAGFCSNGARCLGSLPQLFDHHRPVGLRSKDSEISSGGGFRDRAHTNNIRWSVRLNMHKLVNGRTDLDDQYPDV